MYNSLEWDTIWDGIACKDEKKNLFLESEESFAKTEFQLTDGSNVDIGKAITDLTIEFWFKPTNG
jgi:hypothetical protein